jgi:hypothetical protein
MQNKTKKKLLVHIPMVKNKIFPLNLVGEKQALKVDGLPSIQQSDEGIYSQMEYGSDSFERHGMHDCNPMKTPMNTNQKFNLNFEEAKVDARIYQSLIGSDLFERLYRATNVCVFSHGSRKIVWSSKKQTSTALLFAEAEYIDVISTPCEVVWLRRILEDMKQHQQEATNEELADIFTKSILSNKFIQFRDLLEVVNILH